MPNFIPPTEIIESGIANGEKKVYLALKDQLGDDYTVFHSLEWVNADDDFQAQGEIDFLVFHPEKGVLVCEVKGGVVFRREGSGQWFSGNRRDDVHKIKDPGRQARTSAMTILNKLKKHRQFKRGFPAPVGHCVIFPDVPFNEETPRLSRELIIDATELDDVAGALERVFAVWQRKPPRLPGFGPGDAEAAMELLNPVFSVVRKLSWDIRDEKEVFLRLTDEQKRLMDFMGQRERAYICGRAGSGKTVLALEKARQEAALGKKTLYLCYNGPLAAYAARELEGTGAQAHTFHHFIRLKVEEAGLRWPKKAPPEFFGSPAAELFLEAQGKVDVCCESLVIDEGQDFKDEWWLVIDAITEGGGSRTVFFDPDQRVYGECARCLAEEECFNLDRNCRSTAAINAFARGLIGDEPAAGEVVAGEPPVVERFDDPTKQAGRLRQLLHQLVIDEGLKETQLVVLGTHRKRNSCLAGEGRLGNFRVIKLDDEPGPHRVIYSTIHRFKGLESDVVILVDIDFKAIDPHLYYVGATRARHRLFVLGW